MHMAAMTLDSAVPVNPAQNLQIAGHSDGLSQRISHIQKCYKKPLVDWEF